MNSMPTSNDLSSIKPGDLVAPMISSFDGKTERWSVLHPVKSVSAKRFIVCGYTVDKSTGRETSRGSRTRWALATPEMIAEYRATNAEWDAKELLRIQQSEASSRMRDTTKEIVAFVRLMSEDPRTLPHFETARELVAKLDRDAAIANHGEEE